MLFRTENATSPMITTLYAGKITFTICMVLMS